MSKTRVLPPKLTHGLDGLMFLTDVLGRECRKELGPRFSALVLESESLGKSFRTVSSSILVFIPSVNRIAYVHTTCGCFKLQLQCAYT